MLRRIAISCVILVAVWSGLWLAGRFAIERRIAQQVAGIAAEGGALRYDTLAIGGYPFAYRIEAEAPQAHMPVAAGAMQWEAPRLRLDVPFAEAGRATLQVPERQEWRLGADGADAPLISAVLDSRGLQVMRDLFERVETLRFSGEAVDLALSRLDSLTGLRLDADIEASGISGDLGPRADGAEIRFEAARLLAFVTQAAASTHARPAQAELTGTDLLVDATRSATRLSGDARLSAPRLTVGGVRTVEASAASAEISADLPMLAGDAPQSFAWRSTLIGLILDEAVWTAFDPERRLDRDIRRFELDVSGEAVIGPGAMNAEAYANRPVSEWPIGFERLRLRSLALDALGAEVSAEGEGALENGLLTGALTLRVAGAARAIEALVKSGLLPPQQGIMMRMMLQNFSSAGASEDERVLEIAFRDGLTFVNGAPIGVAPALR